LLKENHNLEEALKNYIELLDKKAYFDAHETLEEAWHPLRKKDHPLKNLAKGLINGAICFEHLKRDRKDALRKATTVLKSFERHKHLCLEGIEQYELFKESCDKIEALKKVHDL
jgi:hydroxymethylpyrimidine pyrophosphatase-like HAD family hydrolase